MLIAEILRNKGGTVIHVSVDATIAQATALLHEHHIGAILAMDGDRIAGVLSERDIVRGLHAKGAAIMDHNVRGCMTAPAVVVGLCDRIDDALETMTARRARHLPVLDGDRLVGIVSIGDLVKHKIEAAEREATELKSYIAA